MNTLVGNNVTLKVSSAISTSRTTNGTAYTAPATGYAIINISFNVSGGSNGNAIVNVGGQPAAYFFGVANGNVAPKMEANAAATAAGGSSGNGTIQIYVGPSQVVATASMTNAVVYFSGVEFINSP